jgi:hypothetical protein
MRERRPDRTDDRTPTGRSTNKLALSVARARRKGRGASRSKQAHLIHLVDALIEHYVRWREECATVASTYENWSRADTDTRTPAYTAYLAALDREELAATRYRHLITQIAQV